MATPADTKLKRVQELVDSLRQDKEEHSLSPKDRLAKLQELKIFGRDVNQSDPIYTIEGIKTLAWHGFDNGTSDSSREALRCLANALMLVPKVRQIFVDLGYPDKAAENFQSNNVDDEFLLGRILFLLTYGARLDISKLLEERKLGKHLNQAIARHARKFTGNSKAPTPTTMEDIALSETLKLLFNITHFAPVKADLFISSIPDLLTILLSRPLLEPPIQSPISHLINAFINLDLSKSATALFPSSNPTLHVNKLFTILDYSLKIEYFTSISNHDFDETIPPLLTLLRKLYEIAPDSVKKSMKLELLCTPEERDLPLGRTSTLASRCLKVTTSAISSQSRELMSTLLFTLSDQNAYEFIRNVGYGFASGYLVSHQIPVPADAVKESESEISGIPINPITGQWLESERKTYQEIEKELAQMSDEEKMREAERLFVLLERLKKTGIIDVKNPIQVAVEEGRFQELPDMPDPEELD